VKVLGTFSTNFVGNLQLSFRKLQLPAPNFLTLQIKLKNEEPETLKLLLLLSLLSFYLVSQFCWSFSTLDQV